ncbi:MAG: DUF2023 family protein [Marinifilaceae bacterium]
MQVFVHHLYEYKKGLRNLILHTTKRQNEARIVAKLESDGIRYLIQSVGSDKINVFFGADNCVDVVGNFIHKSLSDLTHEEDFILGIMLGYDRLKQCERYLLRKSKEPTLKVI